MFTLTGAPRSEYGSGLTQEHPLRSHLPLDSQHRPAAGFGRNHAGAERRWPRNSLSRGLCRINRLERL